MTRKHEDTLPLGALIPECDRCGAAALPGRADDCPPTLSERIDAQLAAIKAKLLRAMSEWPAMNSAHEGWGVLAEECDELWEHVRMKQKNRDIDAMRGECEDVAAMAIRFAIEVCNETTGRK